ncbi:MAG TPA: ATP-binding cassette domain-containing protein [Burkholderiales bacterium]
MTDALQAESVSRRYGPVTAVQDLSVTIAKGEVFGLLGPDGAGKTTCLQMFAAILDPSAGRISVLGRDTVKEAAWVTGRIGYMSQAFSLYGRLTVDENLEFFADLHGVADQARRERRARLLEFAHLEEHLERPARFLSGGMQKKLALCCALIHEPELLVLDEPTTGVDPVSRREFWSILYRAVNAGTTIIVSTSYMDEAERCTRVALLHAGRVVASDTPERLRRDLPGRMLRLKAEPLRSAQAILQRALPEARAYVFGERLHVHLPQEAVPPESLRSVLAAGGARLDEIREIEPGLEDVFVARIGSPADGPAPAPFPWAAPEEPAPSIEARELTMRFGTFTAVDSVSLSVRRGEVFGLLGPNGSGKTTIVRILCGLLIPAAGVARIAGHAVGPEPQAIKSRIGYMSQTFSLYQDLSVVDNLDFFAGAYGLSGPRRAARRAWALALAGLEGQEQRMTRSLSGGLKQRLALACAVMHEPQVLFLDEPTAGVDPLSRRRFWELIYRLSEQGVTVLVTTHYMDEAEHCHTLGLLYRGRLIALGSPQELRSGMRAGEMLELECDRPMQALSLFEEGDGRRASLFGNRLHLLVDDAAAATPSVLARLRKAGHQVRGIERVSLSIEDVFITFIGMEESRQAPALQSL